MSYPSNREGQKGKAEAISRLWEYDSAVIRQAVDQDFENFKSNPANYKIALFNPDTNGYKYLRTLIYQLCRSMSDEAFGKLEKIRNRELGNPICVTYRGEKICLDYLQAVYEIEFIENHFQPDHRRVLEIGAGYGRTCHAIVSNREIESYDIVDIPVCLDLAKRYLGKVLKKSCYGKIRFIDYRDFPLQKTEAYDLCINIDSMSEMNEEIVYDYLHYIDKHCLYFFVKNPVGKYWLKGPGDDAPDKKAVSHALSTGILKDVIDIWDQKMVASAAKKFVTAYLPGRRWTCLADGETVPWSYHWQAIYQCLKNKES